ncbi:MAG: ABC transporter substrate-binding protein [Thermodesulfobacteriota bacterium]|nr:ABC transporter substrate-binding protein [Thermodesulfobacteriota bacterium]
MKISRILIGAIICFIYCMTLSDAAAADVQGVTDKEIKLGSIITTSGPIAPIGIPCANGIQDYVNYVNEEKGGVHGRKITVIVEDDQFKVPKAIAAYNKLWYRDKVFTMMTVIGCGQGVSLLPQYAKHNIVTFPLSSCREFTEPFNPHCFMVYRDYDDEVYVMFDYIFDDIGDKNPKIGLLYPDLQYGRDIRRAARVRAKQYGIKVAAELVLNHGAVDASSQVMALKKAGVKYVIFVNTPGVMMTFFKNMSTIQYDPYVFTIHLANDELVPKLLGKKSKKFIGIDFVNSWHSDKPGVVLARKNAEKANRGDLGKLPLQYSFGVGVAMAFVEGLQRTGRDLTLDKLRKAIETFNGWDADGLLAPLTYTSTNHIGPKKMSVFKTDVEKKELVLIGWREPKKLGGH